MALPAGKLREVVTLQQKNLVSNGRGGRERPAGEPEWNDVQSGIFAEIIPLRGGEALNHAVLRSVQIYKVTIRARDGVSTAQRFLWRGQALDIKALAWSADRADQIMTCESGMPD